MVGRADRHYLVQAAVVSDRGYVSSDDLAILKPDDWLYIRNSISDGLKGTVGALSATCASCGHAVYVHAPVRQGRPPFFKHRTGGPLSCPWYSGNTKDPDTVRAEMYGGKQESAAHRDMCALLLELASLDSRYLPGSGAKGRYMRPKLETSGRYPDVYFEWLDRRYALEFQLANTMQPEIAGREFFYSQEGARLIWVLGRFAPDTALPSGYTDIIHRHRGNAFVLDEAAVRMSRYHKTLCLTVYVQRLEGGYDCRTVKLDDLEWPSSGLSFLEDRTVRPALVAAELCRVELADKVMGAKGTYGELSLPVFEDVDPYYAHRFVGVVLSAWATAGGSFVNYLNDAVNFTGLLDAYLQSADGRPRASLLFDLLSRTNASKTVSQKVLEKLRGRAAEQGQVSLDSEEGDFLICYFPEIYDLQRRLRWRMAGEIPSWILDR